LEIEYTYGYIMIEEPCKSCKGHCCKVGFIVEISPYDEIYNDGNLVWQNENMPKNMKSNGDGYTCIALGKEGECTIWSKRPSMCREFEVNGDRCKAIRFLYGRP